MPAREFKVLSVESRTLRYAGKIIPLRNIAYLEKFEIKKDRAVGAVVFVTLAVIALVVLVGVTNRRGPPPELIFGAVVFLAIVYGVWLLHLLFRRREYALGLQTNAGDSMRWFMTKDEKFLDQLIHELAMRIDNDGSLPPLIANIHEGEIHVGDKVMGDSFKDVRGTIVNRSQISNSFNKTVEKFDADTAAALRRLAEVVESSRNQDAIERFGEFQKELAQEKPRKGILQLLWKGVTEALPSVNTFGDVVLKVMAIVA